jgi:hypothetical protein
LLDAVIVKYPSQKPNTTLGNKTSDSKNMSEAEPQENNSERKKSRKATDKRNATSTRDTPPGVKNSVPDSEEINESP